MRIPCSMAPRLRYLAEVDVGVVRYAHSYWLVAWFPPHREDVPRQSSEIDHTPCIISSAHSKQDEGNHFSSNELVGLIPNSHAR